MRRSKNAEMRCNPKQTQAAKQREKKSDTEGYTAIPIRLVSKLFERTLWHTMPEVGRNLKVNRIDFGFAPAAAGDCRV